MLVVPAGHIQADFADHGLCDADVDAIDPGQVDAGDAVELATKIELRGVGGTYFEPNGGAAASVAVSWLDWQLRSDMQIAKRFVGEDFGLCRDARWSLQRKQFPAVVGGR